MRTAEGPGGTFRGDVNNAQLGTVEAARGIVNIDTIQIVHPRRLQPEQVEVLSRMTGGCRWRRSNRPYGSAFKVRGKQVRYGYVTRVENPTLESLEWFQQTQDGPILITQLHLACDLYFEDIERLRVSWALIERHGVCGHLGADTMFCSHGSYIDPRSQTRRMVIYLKPIGNEFALRIEYRCSSTRGVKALLRDCQARRDDHVPVDTLKGLDLVGAFWCCLEFRKLSEGRVGRRLAGRSRAAIPQHRRAYTYERPSRAIGLIERLALHRTEALAGAAFRADALTASVLAQVLREVAPWFTPRYFDRLQPQLVGIPDKSRLRIGELIR